MNVSILSLKGWRCSSEELSHTCWTSFSQAARDTKRNKEKHVQYLKRSRWKRVWCINAEQVSFVYRITGTFVNVDLNEKHEQEARESPQQMTIKRQTCLERVQNLTGERMLLISASQQQVCSGGKHRSEFMAFPNEFSVCSSLYSQKSDVCQISLWRMGCCWPSFYFEHSCKHRYVHIDATFIFTLNFDCSNMAVDLHRVAQRNIH